MLSKTHSCQSQQRTRVITSENVTLDLRLEKLDAWRGWQRQTTARNMATAGRLSGLIIQAFRSLGKEHVTPERIAKLKQTIPLPERQQLLKDLSPAPAWMHDHFRELAELPR